MFLGSANLLSTFQHPDEINHITLQPKTNGNLFATVCGDSKFRLFDIRQSTTGNNCVPAVQGFDHLT